MKICVQTANLTVKYGVDKAFEIIKSAGFDGVDFNLDTFYPWSEIKQLHPCEILSSKDKFDTLCAEVNAASKKHGIEIHQVHAPFPTFIPGMPEAVELMHDAILKSVEFCGRTGCKLFIVHPLFSSNAREPLSKTDEHKLNIDYYTTLIPELKKHGVTCCLENMWSWDNKAKVIFTAVCSDMRETCGYIDELNAIAGEEIFGFCLDTGHVLLLGGDLYTTVETLGARLKTLHIHDNNGVADNHYIPYMGIGDWDRFCLALKTFGYSGALSFETSGTQTSAFTPEEFLGSTLALTSEVGRYFDKKING